MNRFRKGKLTMAITIGVMVMILVALIFIQFKTIEETNLLEIESMRETELREQLSSYKTKYEELSKKFLDNKNKIEEYKLKENSSEETVDLLKKELLNTNILAGKTDVTGPGIIVTLKNNDEYDITSSDLLLLVNELRYAGAEAISINGIRILSLTDIVDVGDIILIDGNRLSAPFVVKAIGNTTYLSSILNLKDTGYIDLYNNSGKTVSLEESKSVFIKKTTNSLNIKYLEEEKEE